MFWCDTLGDLTDSEDAVRKKQESNRSSLAVPRSCRIVSNPACECPLASNRPIGNSDSEFQKFIMTIQMHNGLLIDRRIFGENTETHFENFSQNFPLADWFLNFNEPHQ